MSNKSITQKEREMMIEDLKLNKGEEALVMAGLNYMRKSGELKSEDKLPPPTTPISAPPPRK